MGRFNKKGSSAIFLTMILVSMISAAMVFSYAAKTAADSSTADGIMRVSARSVLGEYDRRLWKEYGIFAFCGLENQVQDRLSYYFERNLKGMKLGEISCDAGAYSLGDTKIFGEAISEAGKYLLISGLGDELSDFLESESLDSEWKELTGSGQELLPEPKSGNEEQPGTSAVSAEGENASEETDKEEHPERTLKNEAEKKSLPSGGVRGSGLNTSLLEKDGFSIIEKGSKLWYTNEYIMANFRTAFKNEVEKKTFFKNEVEYILFGNYSDEANRKAFRNIFVAMRTAVNSAYIYSDPDKNRETLAMAEALTPGPEAVATQAVLVAAWGAAEAYNDWLLLKEEENVAFFKSSATWAVSLESAIENIGTGKAIKPESDAGKDYRDYLRLFLCIMNEERKLLRTMDLIQLNMRGTYYADFLIAEHITGFAFSTTVNGKNFEYTQNY